MRCSAIVRIKSSAPTIIASPSWINEVKLLRGCASWFVVLSDKTSRFHPRHVRPVKANGGGWSNLWRLSAQDRWPSFARKNSGFLKGKAHFGDRKHKPIYRHKADIAVPGCPLLEGKQKTFARLELFSF